MAGTVVREGCAATGEGFLSLQRTPSKPSTNTTSAACRVAFFMGRACECDGKCVSNSAQSCKSARGVDRECEN